mmetsp:Transcript_87949/g.257114  ORF Transcript_87949/g.257114 Transcript_87949/m.257114 type:complete len:282 (+) Transcript_87949:173-1018(+)
MGSVVVHPFVGDCYIQHLHVCDAEMLLQVLRRPRDAGVPEVHVANGNAFRAGGGLPVLLALPVPQSLRVVRYASLESLAGEKSRGNRRDELHLAGRQGAVSHRAPGVPCCRWLLEPLPPPAGCSSHGSHHLHRAVLLLCGPCLGEQSLVRVGGVLLGPCLPARAALLLPPLLQSVEASLRAVPLLPFLLQCLYLCGGFEHLLSGVRALHIPLRRAGVLPALPESAEGGLPASWPLGGHAGRGRHTPPHSCLGCLEVPAGVADSLLQRWRVDEHAPRSGTKI